MASHFTTRRQPRDHLPRGLPSFTAVPPPPAALPRPAPGFEP